MRPTFLLLALICLPCHADLYQWTDANGQVHFSDSVPSGQNIKARKSNTVAPPPMQNSGEADQARERDAKALNALQEKRDAQDKKDKEAASAAQTTQESCQRLKNRLSFLSGGRVFYTDSAGERQFYSEDELSQMRSNLQQEIQAGCS